MANKTPKGKALGRALREEREARDVGVREHALRLGRDPGTVSRWELGERIPASADVSRYLTLLDVPLPRFNEVMALLGGVADARWVAASQPELLRQLESLVELERTAAQLTEVVPMLVPGLLQTPEYMRAIFEAGDTFTAAEVAVRTAIRVERQRVLTGHHPVSYTALIGEAALRNLLGGPRVMHEQCLHLLKRAREPHIDVRVVPFSAGWRPSMVGSYYLIEPEKGLPMVLLEVRGSTLFLHQETDVADCRHAVALEQDVALSPSESARTIMRYARGWEQRAA